MTMKEEIVHMYRQMGTFIKTITTNLRWRRSILSLTRNSIFVMLGNLSSK